MLHTFLSGDDSDSDGSSGTGFGVSGWMDSAEEEVRENVEKFDAQEDVSLAETRENIEDSGAVGGVLEVAALGNEYLFDNPEASIQEGSQSFLAETIETVRPGVDNVTNEEAAKATAAGFDAADKTFEAATDFLPGKGDDYAYAGAKTAADWFIGAPTKTITGVEFKKGGDGDYSDVEGEAKPGAFALTDTLLPIGSASTKLATKGAKSGMTAFDDIATAFSKSGVADDVTRRANRFLGSGLSNDFTSGIDDMTAGIDDVGEDFTSDVTSGFDDITQDFTSGFDEATQAADDSIESAIDETFEVTDDIGTTVDNAADDAADFADEAGDDFGDILPGGLTPGQAGAGAAGFGGIMGLGFLDEQGVFDSGSGSGSGSGSSEWGEVAKVSELQGGWILAKQEAVNRDAARFAVIGKQDGSPVFLTSSGSVVTSKTFFDSEQEARRAHEAWISGRESGGSGGEDGGEGGSASWTDWKKVEKLPRGWVLFARQRSDGSAAEFVIAGKSEDRSTLYVHPGGDVQTSPHVFDSSDAAFKAFEEYAARVDSQETSSTRDASTSEETGFVPTGEAPSPEQVGKESPSPGGGVDWAMVGGVLASAIVVYYLIYN